MNGIKIANCAIKLFVGFQVSHRAILTNAIWREWEQNYCAWTDLLSMIGMHKRAHTHTHANCVPSLALAECHQAIIPLCDWADEKTHPQRIRTCMNVYLYTEYLQMGALQTYRRTDCTLHNATHLNAHKWRVSTATVRFQSILTILQLEAIGRNEHTHTAVHVGAVRCSTLLCGIQMSAGPDCVGR